MTLEALRCFCAVVELRNFRAAADRLHRSQPAVSQQLKALEAEAGHALYDRKRARPTALGDLYYARARRILESVDALERETSDFEGGMGQELRVGTSDTTALYVLPEAVRRFSEQAPQTRLVLMSRSSDAVRAGVLSGELELGIVTLPQNHPELTTRELFRQQLVLAVPARHPLAKRRSIALPGLKDEPFLLMDEATRTGRVLREYFRAHAFDPQTVLDSGSFEVIKRYIAEGVGLSFLPDTVVRDRPEGIRTLRVPGLPTIPIGAIWRTGAYRSKAAQAFLELIVPA